MTSTSIVPSIVLTWTLVLASVFPLPACAQGGHAPGGPHAPTRGDLAALVQADDARTATARHLDVDAAIADDYADIGAFAPDMGWHRVNSGRVGVREADEAIGLWALHAWIREYDADGMFAPFNPRVP